MNYNLFGRSRASAIVPFYFNLNFMMTITNKGYVAFNNLSMFDFPKLLTSNMPYPIR